METARRPKNPPQGYRIKITLLGISPEIWREVVVSSHTTLDLFHEIIQNAMGWFDLHLHTFIKGRQFYSIPDDEEIDDLPMKDLDSTQYMIADLLIYEEDCIEYMYDMGDGWEHKIELREITEGVPEYPVCIAGARACPPEDAGGPHGYQNLLEALDNPKHEMHREYKEWLGGAYDPEKFDLDQANETLKKF